MVIIAKKNMLYFILCYNNGTGEFYMREDASLTDDELIDLILYGLQENFVSPRLIHHFLIYCAIEKYRQLSTLAEKEYDGRLTTFQYASCLLIALSESSIIRARKVNASLAFDTAIKMCETPYDHSDYGARCLLPLDRIDFDKTFQNHPSFYLVFKNELIENLLSMKHQPLDYALSLKMFYQMSLHCLERDRNKLENFGNCRSDVKNLSFENIQRSVKIKERVLSLFGD